MKYPQNRILLVFIVVSLLSLYGCRDKNNEPKALDLSYTAHVNTQINIELQGSDPKGLPLTYIVDRNPKHGTLEGTPPTLVYTPDKNYIGSDNFKYHVSNGSLNSKTATVKIELTNHCPVAESQSVSTNANIPVDITLVANDPDGDPIIKYYIIKQPVNGALSGTPPDVTYTPSSGYAGADSFNFIAFDGYNISNVATVTITVVNTPPTALDQSLQTSVDTPLAIILTATDPDDGQTLTFTVASQPDHGVLSGAPPNLTYTPNSGYIGLDRFTFYANDGYNDSNIATVEILVGDVWFVDDDATGNGSGRSWKNAFTVVQNAMDAASSGAVIWVAEGTYKRPVGANEPVLTMKKGVQIYGGFIGDENNLTERLDPADYPTTLDGENTSYHVVRGASKARLDGFYIVGGNANGSSPNNNGGGMYNSGVSNLIIENNIFNGNLSIYFGGGMYNYNSSPTITDSAFTGNSADYGGGIYNYKSSPTINDCVFSGNSADSGGGIYNRDYSSPTIDDSAFTGNSADYGGGIYNSGSSPTITDCAFSRNSANVYGGGILNYSSSPTITNCTFSGNSSFYGGGIYNYKTSSTITNCDFSGNSANLGGGIYSGDSSPTITNCTFSQNSARYSGGGVDNDNSSPTITNCTFTGNSANTFGGGINNYYNYSNPCPTIINCTFTGNSADSGGGIYNGDSSPLITDCTFSVNSAVNYGGGILNYSSSPTITNCTFSGNLVTNYYGGGIYNYDSSPIITNCTFSGNSASSGGGIYNVISSSTITNSIIWGNTASMSDPSIYNDSSTPTVTYSDIQMTSGIYTGTGNINADPLFVAGTYGNYYLSQTAAGQGSDSPCLNAGDPASALLSGTTRTDNVADSGVVDMGYHYQIP